jgi:hypothetical protein
LLLWYVESAALTDDQILGNEARNGGGIVVGDNSSLSAESATISHNTAEWGGGIAMWSGSEVYVKECTLSNNNADAGGGFAIHGGILNLTQSIIDGNSVADWGGGVGMWNSTLVADRVTVTGNRAGNGGGFHLSANSVFTLTNNLVAQNDANYGGSLDIWQSAGMLVNNTFAHNTAKIETGGIRAFGLLPTQTLTITNTILWGNGGDDLEGSGYVVSYSDVEEGVAGIGNFSLDPLFVNAAAGDYHLRASSPCIDTGTSVGTPPIDLDGNPRPVDGDLDGFPEWDIGTYEFQLRRLYLPIILKGFPSP